MDDRRFDALTRSLASGGSRRQVLKGLCGLGGGALAGASLRSADAARRSVPTPRPVHCPGNQSWDGDACVCPDGTTPCGPACCSAGATCCDNACCDGTCYGEELCCPASRSFCEVTGECCPEGWMCCAEFGCISPDQCCTSTDCAPETCRSVDCSGDHICASTFDCNRGEAETSCCGEDEVCLRNGSCCTPNCNGVICGGSDGCEGACGCPGDSHCVSDVCVETCDSSVDSCGECAGCECREYFIAQYWFCTDGRSSVGPCASDTDCPTGTICARYESGTSEHPYLCVYPCCGTPA
jgi:hypothetical protein